MRNEQIENQNGDKEKFLNMKNQIAPRLAASWDVNGDSSLKVFGSAGRYSVQIPTHMAVRGAGRSTLHAPDFTYTGIDSHRPANRPDAIDTSRSRRTASTGQKKDPLSVAATTSSRPTRTK